LAETESSLAALREFSLLQPAEEVRFSNEGQLHRVVALITRERQTTQDRALSLPGALAMVNAAGVGDPRELQFWPLWDALRPHVRLLIVFADEFGIAEPTTRLMNELAVLLVTKAQHAEAELLMRRTLAMKEKNFGPEQPETATELNNLARLLQDESAGGGRAIDAPSAADI
jgi:hypothetical protein